MLDQASLKARWNQPIDSQSLAESYRELGRLYASVRRSKSRHELVSTICESALRLSGADLIWLATCDRSRTKLTAAGLCGPAPEQLQSLQIPVSKAKSHCADLITTSFHEARVTVSDNLANRPIGFSIADSQWASACSVPIMARTRAVGVLVACSQTTPFFDASKTELLKLVAQYFALGAKGSTTPPARHPAKRHRESMLQDLLLTQMQHSPHAVLIDSPSDPHRLYNEKLLILWGITAADLQAQRTRGQLPKSLLEKLSDPQSILEKLHFLEAQPMAELRGEIKLKDRRIVEYWSTPLPLPGAARSPPARAWYFQDISPSKGSEEQLKLSEERLKAMFAQAPIGIALIDSVTNRIFEVNQRFADIVGAPADYMTSVNWRDLVWSEDLPHYLESASRLKPGAHNRFQVETRLVRRDGSVIWVHITGTHVRQRGATHPLQLCMIQDITDTKNANARILYLNRVHTVLSSINALIVRVHDRDELFRETCRIVTEEGGFRMVLLAIVDQKTKSIVPVASAGKNEELMNGVRDLLSTPEKTSKTMLAEAILRKAPLVSNDSLNDPRILLPDQYAACGVHSMTIFPLIVADEVIGVLTLYASEPDFFHDEELRLLKDLAGDISYAIDHIEKQERLSYLAYYDDLTGLANRSLFLERVAQYTRTAARSNAKVAIGILDIERFKNINDSMGRTNGDSLLKQTAHWLAPQAGDSSLAARIDADHFALVIPMFHSDGNLARRVEDLMSSFLKRSFHLPGGPLRVGIKGGFSVFPDDGADADTLFVNAEAALKRAKKEGERYLFYTQKMTSTVASQLSLENRLRLALERQEFVLHYQPKVEVRTGKLTGAEALIRWNDPANGMTSPGEFIPVLEDTGLINEVGRWALGKALEDYLRWTRSGLSAVRVAVNVSPLQLRSRNFISDIQGQISVDKKAANALELEITESLVMADVEHSIQSLDKIREMGVQVAVDDFGTGFSSLSYIAKLPIDTLKIDRSFVLGMTGGSEGLALVSNIIDLAHSLKLKVVAEGVETDEQYRLLRLLNCDEAQGYLICPGIAVNEFEERFLKAPTKN